MVSRTRNTRIKERRNKIRSWLLQRQINRPLFPKNTSLRRRRKSFPIARNLVMMNISVLRSKLITIHIFLRRIISRCLIQLNKVYLRNIQRIWIKVRGK